MFVYEGKSKRVEIVPLTYMQLIWDFLETPILLLKLIFNFIDEHSGEANIFVNGLEWGACSFDWRAVKSLLILHN